MAGENQAGAGDADSIIASLQEELALERAKNDVLMEQVLSSEDALADKDIEGFSDVVPNSQRDFWRGRLLENREETVGVLTDMRNRAASAAAPVEPAAAPVAPKPMHNRAAAPTPAPAPGAAGNQAALDRAFKLRNRAQEIARTSKCSFSKAFKAAEAELLV